MGFDSQFPTQINPAHITEGRRNWENGGRVGMQMPVWERELLEEGQLTQ